jgi:excisionase family DNA binding protein
MSSPTPTPVNYLSLGDAAQRAAVSSRTLRRAIRAGKLRAYQVGRLVRIAEGDLKAFVERRPAGADEA